MSLLSRLTRKLASESGELKKIRVESERRRAAKSSGLLPKVEGDPNDPIDKTLAELKSRIGNNESQRYKGHEPLSAQHE
ncbi:MAG TPA: hypothetical protein VGP72_11035 [Planctomycetota bacterium]|jgi:Flp pilus assembly CpaE family ATPase